MTTALRTVTRKGLLSRSTLFLSLFAALSFDGSMKSLSE